MKAIKMHGSSSSSFRFLSKLIFIIITITFITYIFRSFSSTNVADFTRESSPNNNLTQNIIRPSSIPTNVTEIICKKKTKKKTTQLDHLVFAIASSSKVWTRRQNYIKLWWKPDKMKGYVWLDEHIKNQTSDHSLLPTLKISSNTSEFKDQYNNDESAVRIARVVSETFRLGYNDDDDVRWFVMGDDDTFLVTDNLIRVLRKYDHNQFYYIGGSSETHLQNIIFGYNTAFGGGGFAISYPLAKALAEMQDICMKRYNNLFTSDHRIQACMAEIGVPLTREVGFHQVDVLGNVYGMLAAHPVAPLVSLHHLDLVQPIFPNVTQLGSLKILKLAMELDSAGLAQQSICYDTTRNWTISVSWGYTVQIQRGIISARMMEMPVRTFFNWYKSNEQNEFSFNTRPFVKNSCQTPFVHMFSHGRYNSSTNQTFTKYEKFPNEKTRCKWRMANPDRITEAHVTKKRDPHLWDNKAPRRNCCRVLPSEQQHILVVDVGGCRPGEIVERNALA
ncbi:hypothetical protein Leryth_004119 [Lithospermum erythrorhizon]|nr:hypothetical protein Leryth_004119 [Lithospermum erythrorhizon]